MTINEKIADGINVMLTEKKQKYLHYHQERLININKLQAKKY